MRRVATWSTLTALLIVVGPSIGTAAPPAHDPSRPHVPPATVIPRPIEAVKAHSDGPRIRIERVPISCSTSLSGISPCTISLSAVTNKTGLQQAFSITNLSNLEQQSYSLNYTNTGAVVSDSGPSSVVINANSSKLVTVKYATGSTPGTGTFTLTVDDDVGEMAATATVTVTNPPPPTPLARVSVTPEYSTLNADPSALSSKTFTVTNTGVDTSTIKYTRTCTGTAIGSGCTPASDSVRLAPGASSSPSITFTASATAGTVGNLLLKAWSTSDTTARDSGSVAVTVDRDSTTVDIASVNPGSTVERSLCLHVSVATGVSYECGDLRIAYALPTTITLTNTRTPVLLYNSRFAAPHVVIAANVTLPDSRIPDSVSARVLDSVGVKVDSAKWAGSNWAASSTRRIALIFDPISTRNYPTGVQRYSLEVTRVYAGIASRDTVAGEFFVVRRDHSGFGPGWWLAGLERLYLNPGLSTMFWVGGDHGLHLLVPEHRRQLAVGPRRRSHDLESSALRLHHLQRQRAGVSHPRCVWRYARLALSRILRPSGDAADRSAGRLAQLRLLLQHTESAHAGDDSARGGQQRGNQLHAARDARPARHRGRHARSVVCEGRWAAHGRRRYDAVLVHGVRRAKSHSGRVR